MIDRSIVQGALAAGAFRDLPLLLLASGSVIALAASVTPDPAPGKADQLLDAVLEVIMLGALARPAPS